jgi:uncharacterized protein (TIGR00369 family)
VEIGISSRVQRFRIPHRACPAGNAPPGKVVADAGIGNQKKKIGAFLAVSKKPEDHSVRQASAKKNLCFVCGQDNQVGMRLRFKYDDERNRFVSRFRLGKRYTGPPGYCHGGIIAAILDDAMSKVNKLRQVVAVTSEMTVNYLKPVPLDKPLRVESHEVSVHGRRHVNTAEILNEDDAVLARGTGVFIAIDPERIFGKHRKA